jgi:hypothetical protein
MGFFKSIKRPINKVLDDLFNDEDLRTSITYKKKTGAHWDDDLQRNVATEESYTIFAIMLKHSWKSVEWSKSASVQVGDRLYMIRYKDAPADLSINDVIVHGDQTLDIKAIDPIFAFAYSITVEGG